MSRKRPLATASAFTALMFSLTVILSGGHSPFRSVASAATEPVAAAVDAASSPAPSDDPTAQADPSQGASPDASADPATSDPATADPTTSGGGGNNSGGSSGGGGSRGGSGGSGGGSHTPPPTTPPHPGATPAPTPDPTINPTPDPTPAPTPRPTPFPATLTITVSGGQPHLAWSACTSSKFAAYAVVRSTDSEIHFPAETNDTLVALVTNAGTTSLTDTGAPAGVRSYYRVWCTYLSDQEYKSIWTTPTVSVIP